MVIFNSYVKLSEGSSGPELSKILAKMVQFPPQWTEENCFFPFLHGIGFLQKRWISENEPHVFFLYVETYDKP